jgi:hypothetical protein
MTPNVLEDETANFKNPKAVTQDNRYNQRKKA